MPASPAIFISATSSDLRSAREVVANTLLAMGYRPVKQDIEATDAGNLVEVLRRRLASCAAVIQLVGMRYGEEPPAPLPHLRRMSYTQLEAFYARAAGKKVVYIVLPPDFPTDPCPPESDEKAQLQAVYRKEIERSGDLHHSAVNKLELENRVLHMRDDLERMRIEMKKGQRRLWAAALVSLTMLGVIASMVANVLRLQGGQEHVLNRVSDSATQQGESLRNQQTSLQNLKKAWAMWRP